MKVKFILDGVYFVSNDTNWLRSKFELERNNFKEDENKLSEIDSWSYNYWIKYEDKNDYERINNPLKQLIEEECPQFLDLDVIYLSDAYEVPGIFFIFDKEPVRIPKYVGSGFNYGSCNLIKVEEPGFILIVAQND